MNEALQIQEKLKEIATEMAALADAEAMTEEQEARYLALETEADTLTVELAELRAAETRDARRAKAEEIRVNAKAASRVTTSGGMTVNRIGKSRLAIEDDPKKGFKSFGEFALRVMDKHADVRSDEMLMRVAAGTGMTQAVNSEGGVFVPPAFSKTIWEGVMQRSNSLLGECDTIPVDQGVESVTVPAINETSRVDGSRMGGIRGYWKAELTALTESRPAFREVKLTPHELFVYCYISDKLLRNAPGTASRILEQGASDEIAFKIGDAIIEGTGSGQPLGVVGHTATVDVSKETNQPAATILPVNIRKMAARQHVNFRTGSKWYVNQDVLPVLEAMEFPVGVGGVPAYLPPGGLSETPYSRLYGLPVVPLEYCSTVGTSGDIILANFKAYAAAIKGVVDSAYSIHLKFDYAQTAYRLIFEMDGQPWLNSKITPFKGTNTTSPIVTLATRA